MKAQTLQINANERVAGPGEEVFDTTVKKISSQHIIAQQLAAVQDRITERILKTLGSDYKHIFTTEISALNHLLRKRSCFWHSSWKDWKSVWVLLMTATKTLQIWAQLCIDLTAATVWSEHRLEGAVTSQRCKRWRNHFSYDLDLTCNKIASLWKTGLTTSMWIWIFDLSIFILLKACKWTHMVAPQGRSHASPEKRLHRSSVQTAQQDSYSRCFLNGDL